MLFMGALSFGFIQVMISFAEPPPPARVMPGPSLAPSRADPARSADAAEGPAPGLAQDRALRSGADDADAPRSRPRREPSLGGLSRW